MWRALNIYKERYGDVRIPSKFVIDSDDTSWPRICRGLKLGAKTASIRSIGRFVKDFPERKAMLDGLGNNRTYHVMLTRSYGSYCNALNVPIS